MAVSGRNLRRRLCAPLGDQMENGKPKESRTTNWCTITLLLVGVMPLLYALSVGPAVWCMERGWVTESALTTFYWPAIYLTSQFPPIYQLWDDYATLWQ